MALPSPAVLYERLDGALRRIDNIEDKLKTYNPATAAGKIASLEEGLRELKEEVKSLRRVLIGFAMTVAASAIGLALTAYAVAAKVIH